MPEPLTVAVAQPRCAGPDVAANAVLHAEAVRGTGARVIVFPELSLTGYDLAAPAVAADDPRLAPLIDACAGTGSTALAGAPWQDVDGREYIAMLAVTGEGAEAVYAKMHLHGAEGIRFTPGEKPVVFEVDGWRLGLAVCRDAAMPEHAAQTAALGIDAYVAGTLYGEGPEQSARRDAHMRERAQAHGVWVVLSTVAGQSGEYQETSGGSGVWSPDGSPVAQAGSAPGEVLTVILG
ncbi:carbon-nitrogen hydrolase family protein [Streptomyces sp. NPDC127077]|uniref:carbon-nitrogen hydrolase family protein n=1 Tax=Streptomyces sp. NPDC127077 TaxID=3347131 RepID=UPI0036569B37